MQVKTLSVQQPYATLICAGVKTVENRTWTTDYRGRLLIHASGKYGYDFIPFNILPVLYFKKVDKYIREDCSLLDNAPTDVQKLYNLIIRNFNHYKLEPFTVDEAGKYVSKTIREKYGDFLCCFAIVGECELADIVRDSKDDFAEPNCFHWILTNAQLYDKPIHNVLGKLRLWNFDLDP